MYIQKNRLTTPKTCICATPENGRESPASVKRAHNDLKPFFPKQQKPQFYADFQMLKYACHFQCLP